jgi:hypothetical protein
MRVKLLGPSLESKAHFDLSPAKVGEPTLGKHLYTLSAEDKRGTYIARQAMQEQSDVINFNTNPPTHEAYMPYVVTVNEEAVPYPGVPEN